MRIKFRQGIVRHQTDITNTPTCKSCSSKSTKATPLKSVRVAAASPNRGIADLEIRKWVCSGCGTMHDRDINAAKNILGRFKQVFRERTGKTLGVLY